MAPRKSTATEGEAPIGLTDNELRFIKAVFDNMTQKPDADWDMVANDLKLKDAKCAKERFRQMSVRHGWRESGSASSSPRKGKAAGSGGVIDGKVTKKPRTPKKAKKEQREEEPVKHEEEDEDDDKDVKLDDGDEDSF